jgi:hypothetical protein
MNHEMEKRYGQVKHDYLYKKRLKYALEAKLLVDRDSRKAWRKEERARRAAMHDWIEKHIRSLAEAEIRAALDAFREQRKAQREAMRREVEFHKMEYPVYMDGGACQIDEYKQTFKWKDFVREVVSFNTYRSRRQVMNFLHCFEFGYT